MSRINIYIKKCEVRNLTSYWKIENVYIIEAIIELYQDKLKHFLDFFSDTWMELGNPIDELLASKSNEGCTYIRNGFILINIFLLISFSILSPI